jgi:hypothetical protein
MELLVLVALNLMLELLQTVLLELMSLLLDQQRHRSRCSKQTQKCEKCEKLHDWFF